MLPHLLPETIDLPARAPVMFLPGVALLPGAYLPLRIFEPRYRAMLAYALEQQRMFCVATMMPGIDEVLGPNDFFPLCGLGLVRACVGRDDGTSNLVLQGVGRVELGKFVQESPFRIADLKHLPTINKHPAAADRLAGELRELCGQFDVLSLKIPLDQPSLQELVAEVSDPGQLADCVAHALLGDSQQELEVLQALDAADRLRVVLKLLQNRS